MQTHIIHLTPAKHGKASMYYFGAYLGDSKQPIYDAARLLVKNGLAKEDDEITTLRDDTVCLRSSVSVAAGRKVVENERLGPTTRRYRAHQGKAQ
jgi:hypothetical protein